MQVSLIQGADSIKGALSQQKHCVHEHSPAILFCVSFGRRRQLNRSFQITPTTADDITTPLGSQRIVSIDGKRTYLNLYGDATD